MRGRCTSGVPRPVDSLSQPSCVLVPRHLPNTKICYEVIGNLLSPLKYSTNNFGAGVFARYYLFFFSDLFIHAEYEALNYEQVYVNNITWEVDHKEREWVSSLFLGGGYRQWVGQNAFVGITVLFNLLDSYDSPYSNPIFRIGVGVGI